MDIITEKLTPGTHLKLVTASDGSCVQCNASERALTAANIPFEVIPREELTEHELAYLRQFGMQMPVAIAPSGDIWQGFQPDRVAALKTAA